MARPTVVQPPPAIHRWPWVTISMITLTFFCYLLQNLHPEGVSGSITQWGCNPSLISTGSSFPRTSVPATWGLLSATFMHSSWTHLSHNLAVFGVMGIGLEQVLGHRRVFAFYLLAGLLGAGAMVATLADWNVATCGGSIVAAAMWAAWIVQPRSCLWGTLPFTASAQGWRKYLQLSILIVVSYTFLLATWRWFGSSSINLAAGAGLGVFSSVGFCAHLYGAVAGATISGLFILWRDRLPAGRHVVEAT